MNQDQYDNLKRNHAELAAQYFILSSGLLADEFSTSACDCCKTRLAGARYYLTGVKREQAEHDDFEVCTDCYYFNEYGQLDDMTMLDNDLH